MPVMNLMGHISFYKALQLKNKRNWLQSQDNNLTRKVDEMLNNPETLLLLIQKFHNNHNRLVDSMQGTGHHMCESSPIFLAQDPGRWDTFFQLTNTAKYCKFV